MAGSIDLTTQGITSFFRVEKQTPTPRPKASVEQVKASVEEEARPGTLKKEEVQGVADALNSAASVVDRDLQFSVDEESGRVVIKVTNSATGELIRVIPPEEVSRTRDSFGSLVGLLYSGES